MNVSKLPIDLKNYKAPISLWGRVGEYWWVMGILVYLALVLFVKSGPL